VRRIVVATLQAVSGAGSEGPRALDLLGNVVPYIPREEEKIERELDRILGSVNDGVVERSGVTVSAHCHRVPTLDGHLEAASFELERHADPAGVAAAMAGFRSEIADLDLPTAPAEPIVVRDEDDRPQPRLDRDRGDGMTVVVGRIRECAALGIKLVLLSHNTVRGAAGGTLLNAELLAVRGELPRRSSA
jgi:aspartate-semialdehyde dehydrogenase